LRFAQLAQMGIVRHLYYHLLRKRAFGVKIFTQLKTEGFLIEDLEFGDQWSAEFGVVCWSVRGWIRSRFGADFGCLKHILQEG